MSHTTRVALAGGALVLTGAAFLGVWPLLCAVLLVPVAGLLIVQEFRERQFQLERKERQQDEFRRWREELLEMPLMTPLLTCPDCGLLGAHLAELTANGAHWRRECMDCGHRWLEEDL
jgi:hypothetical protein